MPTLNACDFAYPPSDVEAFYQRLHAKGIRVVQRYLWRGGKGVTSREIAAAKAVGIRIVYGYEAYANSWRGGAATGVAHARDAAAIAADLGVPKGEPIYYAVDEDAAGLGLIDTAVAYVHGANTPDHPARAYGQYAVAEALKQPTFQTYAWSGGQISEHAALYQWRNSQPLAGGTVDYCEIRDAAALGLTHPTPDLLEEIMAYYKDKTSFEAALKGIVHDELVDMVGMLGGKGAQEHDSGDFAAKDFDVAGVLERIDPKHKAASK